MNVFLRCLLFLVTISCSMVEAGYDADLNAKICGIGQPSNAGKIESRPLFAIKGIPRSISVEGATEYYFPNCVTGCGVSSTTNFWKSNYSYSFNNNPDYFVSTLLQGYPKGEMVVFEGGRSASITFDQFGQTFVTAETRFSPDQGSDFLACSTSVVFVQNKPEMTYSGQRSLHVDLGKTGKYVTFGTAAATIDNTFSRFAVAGKPVEFHWTVPGKTSPVITTTGSLSLFFRDPRGMDY